MSKKCKVCGSKVKYNIEKNVYQCSQCGQEYLEEKKEEVKEEKAIIEKKNTKDTLKSVVSWLLTIVICLVSAKLFTTFVISSVEIDGASMYSTLDDGDKALTDALFYKFGKINRFDIVIIEMDHGPHKGEKLVKRVVGLPGETIKYENNTLYINGEVVAETFIDDNAKSETDIYETKIPEGKYFVLGDNRGNSSDSRYFGFVNKSEIIGRGLLRFMVCTQKDGYGECSKRKFIWPSVVR